MIAGLTWECASGEPPGDSLCLLIGSNRHLQDDAGYHDREYDQDDDGEYLTILVIIEGLKMKQVSFRGLLLLALWWYQTGE